MEILLKFKISKKKCVIIMQTRATLIEIFIRQYNNTLITGVRLTQAEFNTLLPYLKSLFAIIFEKRNISFYPLKENYLLSVNKQRILLTEKEIKKLVLFVERVLE